MKIIDNFSRVCKIVCICLLQMLCLSATSQECDSARMVKANELIDSIIQFELEGRVFDTHVVWTDNDYSSQHIRYQQLSEEFNACLKMIDLDKFPAFFTIYYASMMADNLDIQELERLLILHIHNNEPVFAQHFHPMSRPFNSFLVLLYYTTYEHCTIDVDKEFDRKTYIDSMILYDNSLSDTVRDVMLRCYVPHLSDRNRILEIVKNEGFIASNAMLALTRLNIGTDIQLINDWIISNNHQDDGLWMAMMSPNPGYFENVCKSLQIIDAWNIGDDTDLSYFLKIYAYLTRLGSEDSFLVMEKYLKKRPGVSRDKRKRHRLAITIALQYFPGERNELLKKKYKLKYRQWMEIYEWDYYRNCRM